MAIGCSYRGAWFNGKKCGKGTITIDKNGYMIRSAFRDDMLNGEGTRAYITSKKELEGVWLNNELITGKMTLADGTTYEGDWVGGRPHGHGVKTIPGGKRYEGMFSRGRPWGMGTKIQGKLSENGYWEGLKFIIGEVSAE